MRERESAHWDKKHQHDATILHNGTVEVDARHRRFSLDDDYDDDGTQGWRAVPHEWKEQDRCLMMESDIYWI